MRSRVLAILATASVALVTAAPAMAAGSGSVGVSVNGASPCITVSGQFDYGTMNFSSSGAISQSAVTTGPSVANCSGSTENYVAHISNLVNGVTTWSPMGSWVNPCPNLNVFNINVAGFGSGSATNLTSTDQAIGNSSSATPINWASVFVMPCAGSNGAGLPMSGSITLTASF